MWSLQYLTPSGEWCEETKYDRWSEVMNHASYMLERGYTIRVIGGVK